MHRQTISSWITFLYYFTLFLLADLGKTQAVRYPRLRGSSCPGDNSRCVTITSCNAALKNIKEGTNPIVCGWESDVPLVCCPQEDKMITVNQQKKISRLSPKGCGIRDTPVDENTLIYPTMSPKGILESGIEPRAPNTEPGYLNIFVPMFAVGGNTASVVWPWMVAIFNGGAGKQLCGGTLIDERHIITAAHCFAGRSLDPSLYSVQIGELFLAKENTKYAVKEIKLHENYRARYYYDDIAIMRLADPLINFTAACLPSEDDLKHGDNVTVLGWGDLSYGGPSSSKLQEVVDIPVVEVARCDAKFRTLPGAPFPRGITDTFICAGLEEGGRDACQGDSGGPLLQQHPEGSWSLVGVVSFGYKCGEPGYPGVYTKITAYLQWIENFIVHQNEVVTKKKARSQNFEYIDNKPIWRSVTERVLFPS